jgi:hypothetical protein
MSHSLFRMDRSSLKTPEAAETKVITPSIDATMLEACLWPCSIMPSPHQPLTDHGLNLCKQLTLGCGMPEKEPNDRNHHITRGSGERTV